MGSWNVSRLVPKESPEESPEELFQIQKQKVIYFEQHGEEQQLLYSSSCSVSEAINLKVLLKRT